MKAQAIKEMFDKADHLKNLHTLYRKKRHSNKVETQKKQNVKTLQKLIDNTFDS